MLLVVCLLALAGMPAGAQAQPVEPPRPPDDRGPTQPEVTVHLDALEGVLSGDQALQVQLRVANETRRDRTDLRIVSTVHRRLTARWEYQAALDEGVVGTIVHAATIDVAPVPAGGSRSIRLQTPAAELGLGGVGQAGVYPLRVQLVADGEVADELVTSLVLLPEEVSDPIRVTAIAPLALPPQRDASGALETMRLPSAIGPRGLLTRSIEALTAHPDANPAITLDAVTLEDLVALTDGEAVVRPEADGGPAQPVSAATQRRAAEVLDVFRDLAGARVDVIPQPYAGADLVALTRFGEPGAAERRVSEGAARLEQHLRARPAAGVAWPPDGVNDATLQLLRGVGARTLVLDEAYLRIGARTNLSPSPVRRLRAPGGPDLTALVPDPWLADTLAEGVPGGPVAAAQRVVGELASVYFEQPGIARRGVLLAPGRPDTPVHPETLEALLGALEEAPFVRPTRLRALATAVVPESRAVRLRYPTRARDAELPAAYLDRIATARRALSSLSGVLDADQDTPERFDRLLLQATSIAYRGQAQPAGLALATEVSRTVAELYRSVEVLEPPPVTLTSVEGEIPVTVRSRAPVALRVRLTLLTPRYDVEGGPVRELVLAPNDTAILTFAVRDRAPGGTAPIRVVISDTDGRVNLAGGTIVVRSTAVNAAALFVTAGAGLALLAFGLRGAARRRGQHHGGPRGRSRRRPRAPARAGASGSTP